MKTEKVQHKYYFNQNNYFLMYACNRIRGINNVATQEKFEKMERILNIKKDELRFLHKNYDSSTLKQICRKKFNHLFDYRKKFQPFLSRRLNSILHLVSKQIKYLDLTVQYLLNFCMLQHEQFSSQIWLRFLQIKEAVHSGSNLQDQNYKIWLNQINQHKIALQEKYQRLMDNPQIYVNQTLFRKDELVLKKHYQKLTGIKFPQIIVKQKEWNIDFLGRDIFNLNKGSKFNQEHQQNQKINKYNSNILHQMSNQQSSSLQHLQEQLQNNKRQQLQPQYQSKQNDKQEEQEGQEKDSEYQKQLNQNWMEQQKQKLEMQDQSEQQQEDLLSNQNLNYESQKKETKMINDQGFKRNLRVRRYQIEYKQKMSRLKHGRIRYNSQNQQNQKKISHKKERKNKSTKLSYYKQLWFIILMKQANYFDKDICINKLRLPIDQAKLFYQRRKNCKKLMQDLQNKFKRAMQNPNLDQFSKDKDQIKLIKLNLDKIKQKQKEMSRNKNINLNFIPKTKKIQKSRTNVPNLSNLKRIHPHNSKLSNQIIQYQRRNKNQLINQARIIRKESSDSQKPQQNMKRNSFNKQTSSKKSRMQLLFGRQDSVNFRKQQSNLIKKPNNSFDRQRKSLGIIPVTKTTKMIQTQNKNVVYTHASTQNNSNFTESSSQSLLKLNSKQKAEKNVLLFLLLKKYPIQNQMIQLPLDMTTQQINQYYRTNRNQIQKTGRQQQFVQQFSVELFQNSNQLLNSPQQPKDFIQALLKIHINQLRYI